MSEIPQSGAADPAAAPTGVSRRRALASLALVSLATSAGGGFTSPVLAATESKADSALRVHKGKYALINGKVISGYFAFPRGKYNLDLEVLLPGEGGLNPRLEQTARRLARMGKMVIAADLTGTYSHTQLIGHDAMVADIKSQAASLAAVGNCNGVVNFTLAA